MSPSILTLIALFFIVHGVQYFLRHIYFYRFPRNVKHIAGKLMSPVEGRVMYIRPATHNSLKSNKQGRKLAFTDLDLDPGTYIHIGIFMSPLDNHHMVTPLPLVYTGAVSARDTIGEENSMLDSSDLWNIRWWKNWWDKKASKFITVNRATIFSFRNGIRLVMIYDKYVNKLTRINKNLESGRTVLGLVHRGSQCEVIVPSSMFNSTLVRVGQRVSFNDALLELK